MTQSSEFPEYTFVRPRGYSTGRSGQSATYCVIHTTEGSAHSRSAEDGAAYDARRTDDVSTHFFVDSNSVVQCVLTKDTAWTARAANSRGVQFELCGRASTTDWLDNGYYEAMLNQAAQVVAKVCRKYGMPARWLTDAELRKGNVKGLTTHAQVTRVLGGTHTDPGPHFPFSWFASKVNSILNPPTPAKPATVAVTTKEPTLMLIRSNKPGTDTDAIYKTDGLTRTWLSSMDQVRSLSAAMKAEGGKGAVTPVPDVTAFGLVTNIDEYELMLAKRDSTYKK